MWCQRRSFALKGETRKQGEEVTRYALRLVLALGAIEKGKLLQASPEAILPRGVRSSWPGKEGPEDLVDFLMDASGETLHVIDLQDGEHVSISYTEAEQVLFNAFLQGDSATTINLFELWSEAVVIATFAQKYPGKILRMINDNTSAQNWTDFSRHRDPRVEQILASGGKQPPKPRQKRKEVAITAPVRAQINKLVDEVRRLGKQAKTRKAYERMQKDWVQVCDQLGWTPELSVLAREDPLEATSRVLTWFGYERLIHGLKATSLRQKKAAVRDWHISQGRKDPFAELPAISDWLSNLEKIDGPPKPKIPVPISLLKFIIGLLKPDIMSDQAMATALCVGYWFLLRASEYLATDSGLFDPERAVSWNDLLFRITDEDGNARTVSPESASKALARGLEVSATLTLFSNKNRLGTCTRSVVSTPNSSLCPVAALLKQYHSFKKHMGRAPKPEESIFVKDLEGGVFRRKDISAILKGSAQLAGIPDALVGSHSLRRGGASAYIASGASDDDVMRQGRWTSEAYRGYVFPSLDKLRDALHRAQVKVPRFERN